MKLLVKNIEYFEMEVDPDRLDEIGDWQSVVDLDFDIDEATKVSNDYYEFLQILD